MLATAPCTRRTRPAACPAAPARRSSCSSKNRVRDVGELRRERRVRVEHQARGPRPSRTRRPPSRPTPCGRSRRAGRGRAAAALSEYQRCGMSLRACTASTSACTDSSLASLARFRAAIQSGVRAQAVVGRLVGEQRVEDERPGAQPGREPSVTAAAAAGAARPVGRREQREPLLERDRLAVEVERDRGRQLVEEARPRARAGDVLLGEDLLLRLGEQVRPVAAGRAQVVAARTRAGRRRAARRPARRSSSAHSSSKNRTRVLIAVRPLLHPLHQRAELGIGGVDREAQARRTSRPGRSARRARPSRASASARPAGVERRDLARGGSRCSAAIASAASSCGVDSGGALPVDQRLEVPGDVGRGEVGGLGGGHDGVMLLEPTARAPRAGRRRGPR